MKKEFVELFKEVQKTNPLVHHITNYVTVNDCANIVLASGGSPIMADDALEVEEITTISNSLVINIGTLTERTIESMMIAGKKANELQHPIILDPVGVGASTLRTQITLKLLNEINFSVIRGNISEIKTLTTGHGKTSGVDANVCDVITEETLEETISLAKKLSAQTKAVIVITGVIDLVVNEKVAYVIRNGHAMMSKITGTGCMLTSVIATFMGANQKDLAKASALAVALMGRCGEIAFETIQSNHLGTASFKIALIDQMSVIDELNLMEGLNIEIR